MTVCSLIFIESAVSLVEATESHGISASDNTAATEGEITKYCFTNNETWRHGRCEDIINLLESSSADHFVEARLLLAKAYEGLKTYATNLPEQKQREAQERDVIESLLARGVRTPEILYSYARALPPKESVPVFNELLAKEPEHVNGLTILAFHLQRLGGEDNNKEAAQLLQKAYKYDSGSMKYFSAMKAYEALRAVGLEREATEFRQQVSADLQIDAASDKVKFQLSENGSAGSVLKVVGNLADKACIQAYLALEDLDPCILAVRQLQELHNRQPNEANILRRLIGALKSLSVFDSSYQETLQDYYERYLQLQPNDVQIHFEYSQLLPTDEQFQLLKRIVTENRKVPAYVHYSLAKHFEYNGDEDAAIAELTKAFDLADPADRYSYGHDLLQLLQSQNRHEEAEKLRERMREIG